MKLDWGKSILLFFVVFLTLAFIFIVFSFKHKSDLVSDDYYEEGAAYTQQININKRSAIFQDSIQVDQRNNYVVISFGKKLANDIDSLSVHFYYPADKQKDYKLSFDPKADSLVVSNSFLSHGRCLVKIYWQMKNEDYYLEKDLYVR